MTFVSTLIASLNWLGICTTSYCLSPIIPRLMPDLPTFVALGRALTKMTYSTAVALRSWSSLINSLILGSSHRPGIPLPLVVVLMMAGVVSIIVLIVVLVVPVTTLVWLIRLASHSEVEVWKEGSYSPFNILHDSPRI
ncbi:hypothetical protein Tco_0763284 [Tanacetum coccineum]